MAKRHENSTDEQHGHGAIAQHASSTTPNDHGAPAQHGGPPDAQHAMAWQMDQDGPLDDSFLDMPIPYRLSHEAGLELDAIDSRGLVP